MLLVKEHEKVQKYTDLAFEIKRLWPLCKVRITFTVIGALGTFSNNLQTYLEDLYIGLSNQIIHNKDTLLHFVKDHDNRKSLYSTSRQSMKLVWKWKCLQYHLQRKRQTLPMPIEQKPRPNTRLASSSTAYVNTQSQL